ncbi:hypothetical protein PR003_g14423 [Phytophthora rubi]|uniref:Uncharacterized protein n=1 Tax=Phytophthora rubi TaxID=129364 RepID=A0A6A3LF52_9STRA|nr:hypothetical protein PR002_g13326 [Phytophthora rubi]KAE9023348.1 hypothetical protein PR001_g12931 [Phytophthora rubi]KAE9332613.1 hypothetical protein PR003_g14423 [Phytophthora rubi]
MVEEDDKGCYSIDKATAIKLAGMAWTSSKIGRNTKIGFRACGIFPLSLVTTNGRLQVYEKNGASRHVNLATWLHLKPIVEKDILTLPPRPKNSTKRKRVSLGGKLLTHAKLEEAAAASKGKRSRRIETGASTSASAGIGSSDAETGVAIHACVEVDTHDILNSVVV